jgi:eukaryotic-like serine/threonine-protein kinase
MLRLNMEADRVRAQLERILASTAFASAERPSTFLRFVVEGALAGRTGEIKESVIAIEVLGRKPSFDSKADPIVRVEAGRLRDRLRAYYQGEGEADRVLIAVPKGGYVPQFSERQPPLPTARIEVLRLSILPPDRASFDSFAVSPDGRQLAFTAALNGKLLLWVRALDSLEPEPLIGTDHATYPFWSPDSRAIGFFTTNKLKTVEIAGGPARDIADIVVGRGGAWSPDGVIVFCPRPVGVLHQVAAAGGTTTPVTSLDASRAEVGHGFPQFLPDGRHFTYLAMSSRASESSIRAGSLDSTTTKVLLESDTSAAYAPALPGHPGSLLFVAHGALMSQPFDSRRLELHGERTVLVPQVRYRRWHQASFSVSNDGVLLYQGGSAENQQFSWVDRQGALLTSIGPRNDYISFSLSPDERYVAFYRDDDPATAQPKIWVMDLLRDGAVFRLTDPGMSGPEFTPVWSPDGREILFSRGDDRRMRLMRQALNGGDAACVLDSEGPKFPTDWSSDGRFITYTSQAPDYRHLHTWTVSLRSSGDAEQSTAWLQHSHNEANAYFSPEGTDALRWIAYASVETGRDEVYVRDFPAGAQKWQVSNQGGLMPHWRRDGRELFYLAPDGTLMAVSVNLGATCEVGAPRALFATGIRMIPRYKEWMNQYAVGRDGQRFLFNRPVADTAPAAITAVIPW